MLGELHFIRPLWLLALPLLAVAAWWLFTGMRRDGAWGAVVAPQLQPYVLERAGAGRRRDPWLAVLAGVLALLALAGPAWERAPQPTFVDDSALVIVLDLSRSMDATDLPPSRLERARLKIRDLLQRKPAGQIGLVVYSANAFTVTPLTTDTRNIEQLLGALTTDIMPSQGSFPAVGLAKGAELLRQAGVSAGDLLLVTDEAGGQLPRDAALELARQGYRTSVLAVGTAEGAPIPEPGGGLLRSPLTGEVVMPRLHEAPLRRLAAAGEGRFARLSAGDSDLDHLLAPVAARAQRRGIEAGEAESLRWVDRGLWVALLLVPLALLAFRRGVLAPALAVAVMLPTTAEAMDWRAALRHPDQRALQALESGEPDRAAELFEDPEWRAVALYRAGRYAASAQALEGLESAAAHYNRGNALARAGRIDDALQAYEEALARDPAHADATHNRDVLRRLQAEQEDAETGTGSAASGSVLGEAGPGLVPAEPDVHAPARPDEPGAPGAGRPRTSAAEETERSMEQWLRQVDDDPGGLLRRKFQYQYGRQNRDQDGNPAWPGDQHEPW